MIDLDRVLPGRHEFGPGGDDQHPAGQRPLHQQGEDVARGRVGPVDVVEADDAARRYHRAQQRMAQGPGLVGAGRALLAVQHAFADRIENALRALGRAGMPLGGQTLAPGAHPAHERMVGHLPELGRALQEHAFHLQGVAEMLHQEGFSQSRLAAHQADVTSSLAMRVDEPRHLLVPSAERAHRLLPLRDTLAADQENLHLDAAGPVGQLPRRFGAVSIAQQVQGDIAHCHARSAGHGAELEGQARHHPAGIGKIVLGGADGDASMHAQGPRTGRWAAPPPQCRVQILSWQSSAAVTARRAASSCA